MTRFDFIHIGLGKCMSTRLQGHWDADPGYNSLSARGISAAIDQIVRAGAHSKSGFMDEISKIKLEFPNMGSDKVNILSSEDITFSYLHNSELGDSIHLKDEAASELLAGMSAKVLMLVRNPVDWIRSCYAQHVKEGGCVALNEYLVQFRSVILNNLNLKRRIELWSSKGAEIIVLPIELASENDEKFWSVYEERLSVSRPSNWSEKLGIVRQNLTKYASIEPHRRLNKALSSLEVVLANTDAAQKSEMINFMEAVRKLCVRRALSFADEQALGSVYDTLGIDRDADGALEFLLDDNYKNLIEETFLAPLRSDQEFLKFNCLDQYMNKLHQNSQPEENRLTA